jgi:hypothetical protein
MKTIALTIAILASSAFAAQAQYYDYNNNYDYQQEAQGSHQNFVDSNNAWAQDLANSPTNSPCYYDPECRYKAYGQ